jgi:hypothetical protein
LKIGTKTQFSMLMLILLLVYTFWFDIAIGCLHVYAAITKNPHGEKLLGEYYLTMSTDYSSKAAIYFQKAMQGYKIQLPGTPVEQKRWIEYIIGNQYECGKGVEPNLIKAKYWYQEAVKDGFPKGKDMLDKISELLTQTVKETIDD